MCVCISTRCTGQHTQAGPRRGNDVHDVLSLITRLASVDVARAIVVYRPLLYEHSVSSLRSSSRTAKFVYIASMHCAVASGSLLCHRPILLAVIVPLRNQLKAVSYERCQ